MKTVQKYSTSLLVFALLLLGASKIFTAEAPWVTVRETSDGIVVKARERPGTSIRAVLASTEVAAPPKAVIDVTGDPNTFKSSENHLEDHRVYKTDNPNVWHVYYLVDFPFIAKRDYTLRYEKTVVPEKNLYQLSWHAAPNIGPPAREDIVRVTLADGWVKAVPKAQGTRSVIEYYVTADPGGNIPAWVVNIANRMTVPDLIRQIRDAAVKRNLSEQKTREPSR